MAPRVAAALAALLGLAACEGIGFSQFDTETEAQKKNASWFDSFYGTQAKEETDWWGGFYGTGPKTESCSFYGNCPTSGSQQMQGGGMWGNTGANTPADAGASSSGSYDSGW